MAYAESYDITGETRFRDKITAIKNLAKSYEMRMRGFRWDTSNDKWVISGKALAGDDFINQSVGIVTSFAEPANLMTTKKLEKFVMEFADGFFRINVQCVNDISVPADTNRTAIKMFKDTMSNLGDIITGSKNDLKSVFKDPNYDEGGGMYE